LASNIFFSSSRRCVTSFTLDRTSPRCASTTCSRMGAHLSGCHRISAVRSFFLISAVASDANTPETEGKECGHGISTAVSRPFWLPDDSRCSKACQAAANSAKEAKDRPADAFAAGSGCGALGGNQPADFGSFFGGLVSVAAAAAAEAFCRSFWPTGQRLAPSQPARVGATPPPSRALRHIAPRNSAAALSAPCPQSVETLQTIAFPTRPRDLFELACSSTRSAAQADLVLMVLTAVPAAPGKLRGACRPDPPQSS